MNPTVRILLFDDDGDDRAFLVDELNREMPSAVVVELAGAEQLATELKDASFDLAIIESRLSWIEGLELLQQLKKARPESPVIMFTAEGGVETAVEAMKAGLDDFVAKSSGPEALLAAVRSALEKARLREAKKSSEARYRSVFVNVPIGLFVVSTNGTIIDANAALLKILGFEGEGILPVQNIRDFQVNTEVTSRWLERLQREGIARDMEIELVRPDGRTVWIEMNARLERDDEGGVLFYHGAVEDITERRHAGQVLRESEERFAAFMDNSPVMAFLKDQEGRYVYLNEPCQKLFGPLLGHLDDALFTPSQVMQNRASDLEVMSGAKAVETLDSVATTAGDLRCWMTIKFPVIDAAGQKFVGGVAIDVTERERAREAESQNERRFRDLFESSPDAIFVEDPSGWVLDVNPAACRLHRMSREELIGKNAVDLVPEDMREEMASEFQKLACEGLSRFESCALTADGDVIPVAISVNSVEHMGRLALLLHVRDMSEHKQLQAQFLHSQKMEAIGRLAGGIAHDFNNLLTAILGYNALMLKEIAPGHPLRSSAEQVRQAAERAANLTQQLLAFSRKQTLRLGVIDLNVVVCEIEKLLRRLIGEDIELLDELAEGIGRVRADRGQIEQVIINLAVNARDAMPEGGQLTIRTANLQLTDTKPAELVSIKPGDYTVLTISDTGTGMSDEVKEHIFEPFFTTKELGKGTGLGLATSYGIIEQCGGHILFQTVLGKGTKFDIYFPQVKEALDAAHGAKSSDELPGGQETILLVEDEPVVRELGAQVLGMLGYRVIEAHDGEDALRVAKEIPEHIDLLMTDVMMPRMGGNKLAAAFRTLYPSTKVLLNSGSMDDPSGQRKDGTFFLRKPFTPTVLAQKLREILDEQK